MCKKWYKQVSCPCILMLTLGERQELVVCLLSGFLHPFNLFIESHGFQLSFSFFPGMQRDLDGIKKGCVTQQKCPGLVYYLQSSTAPQNHQQELNSFARHPPTSLCWTHDYIFFQSAQSLNLFIQNDPHTEISSCPWVWVAQG